MKRAAPSAQQSTALTALPLPEQISVADPLQDDKSVWNQMGVTGPLLEVTEPPHPTSDANQLQKSISQILGAIPAKSGDFRTWGTWEVLRVLDCFLQLLRVKSRVDPVPT